MNLHILSGVKAGQVFKLSPPGLFIGRESDNDIQVCAEGISRYHVRIDFTEGKWKIKDLGSSNGTKVNDAKIDGETELKAGDIILLGNEIIRCFEESPGPTKGDEKPPQEIRRKQLSPEAPPGDDRAASVDELVNQRLQKAVELIKKQVIEDKNRRMKRFSIAFLIIANLLVLGLFLVCRFQPDAVKSLIDFISGNSSGGGL